MTRILRILVSCAVFVGILVQAPAHADDVLQVASVSYSRTATALELKNDLVSRAWVVNDQIVRETLVLDSLTDESSGQDWAAPGPDFWVTIDGVRLTSSDFGFKSAAASAVSDGISLNLQYEAPVGGSPISLKVIRTIVLHDRAPAFDIITKLETQSAVVLSSFGLDAVATNGGFVEVQAYNGGSDWRDDFRHSKIEASTFDDEGEVARFDDGGGKGFYMVSDRRGGVSSRVGRDNAVWVGADYPRDLADLGPITYGSGGSIPIGPSFATNHLDNPAYPAPVRARKIPALSSIELGRTSTGVYSGGADEAGASYSDFIARHRIPNFPRQVLLNSFHPWSHSVNLNETTMRAQADKAALLGIDTIVIDDQWQGGTGGESGDWQWDTVRFPDRNGDRKADIVDYFASKGIKLGLWMSPAEFNGASNTFNAHPDWACTPIGTLTSQKPDDAGIGVWDFNNPDFRSYITGVVDRIINQWGVLYFKFDFQTWVDCPPHDYNDYEQAFAEWVDSLEASYPNATFTFDETNDQRMYAFESVVRGPSWFDNSHSHKLPNGSTVTGPAQVLHDIWCAAPWIPPSTLGVGLYDGTLPTYSPEYLMPMAALTHMTFWKDLTSLTTAQFNSTKWWLDWYHAHSSELGGTVYALSSSDPWDGVASAAFQPWDRATGTGYLFAFRQDGAQPVVALRGLNAGDTYVLIDVRSGSIFGTFSGTQLQTGITIPLSTRSASVFSIQRQ